jgi:hypothetical protein
VTEAERAVIEAARAMAHSHVLIDMAGLRHAVQVLETEERKNEKAAQ